jgi:hypothetical protein
MPERMRFARVKPRRGPQPPPAQPRRGACSVQERRDRLRRFRSARSRDRASPGAQSGPSDTTRAPGRFTPRDATSRLCLTLERNASAAVALPTKTTTPFQRTTAMADQAGLRRIGFALSVIVAIVTAFAAASRQVWACCSALRAKEELMRAAFSGLLVAGVILTASSATAQRDQGSSR